MAHADARWRMLTHAAHADVRWRTLTHTEARWRTPPRQSPRGESNQRPFQKAAAVPQPLHFKYIFFEQLPCHSPVSQQCSPAKAGGMADTFNALPALLSSGRLPS